jgi:G:T/U-mismatch repair DNA glycosylase
MERKNMATIMEILIIKRSNHVRIPAVCLPSTSPANAVFSLEKLVEIWADAIKKVEW